MPNVMAAQQNTGGALCESSVAQETAKYRANAKFGWPPVSDVAAERSQDAKAVENCWGSQTPEPISAISGPKFAIL